MKYHCTLAERHAELLRQHNASWLNLWNAIAAYYYALLGKTDKIPEVFRAHRLSTVHTLAPGKPMIEMIENQSVWHRGTTPVSSAGAKGCLLCAKACTTHWSRCISESRRSGV